MDRAESYVTACAGRWERTDPAEIRELDAVRQVEACPMCWAFFVETRTLERGLRDLMQNAVTCIGRATTSYLQELRTMNPALAADFERWLGPCPHNESPVTRCASCAPALPI